MIEESYYDEGEEGSDEEEYESEYDDEQEEGG